MKQWNLYLMGVSTALLITACSAEQDQESEPLNANEEEPLVKDFTENREACLDRNPQRNLYFGDLHVHTSLSFDAWAYEIRVTPTEAYRFAKGESVALPPLDENGVGTRQVQLNRPLDFAAITDHAELLAETMLCADPNSPAYNTARCTNYNQGGGNAVDALALVLGSDEPVRWDDICGLEGINCSKVGQQLWSELQEATEQAYDRSESCSFTAFHGYEYTSAQNISNQHRNIIFRGEEAIAKPITLFDAPTAVELWKQLDSQCLQTSGGCDAIAIPHNANWSNGNMFPVTSSLSEDPDEQKELAELRAKIEPLVEMFQHKGDAECRDDFENIGGDKDPECKFEKMRIDPITDCGDGTGAAAMIGLGCISRRDYARTTLIEGFREEKEHGINPWKIGFIGGTDTHNGTPGMVEETLQFPGHVGIDDDEPLERLGFGNLIPGGILANPGGLVAAWAEENSREALFTALRSREVYATSGTRISLRFFGGWNYPMDMCNSPDWLANAYDDGVPMGGDLDDETGTAPRFLISALADPGTSEYPGAPLHKIQVIKGWLDANGTPTQKIIDVIGGDKEPLSVDMKSCEREEGGTTSLCTVWEDPDFDPTLNAFYYARVLEEPSCRYHTYLCNQLEEEELPLGCTSPQVAKTIQERAWSSPIWFNTASEVEP